MSATVYAVLFATLVASLFGLTHFSFSQVMSGAIGRFVATVLTAALGSFGAWAILLASLAATLVLCIDLDVQKTADRLLCLFRDKAKEAQLRFKQWYQIRQMRRKAAQNATLQEKEDCAAPSSEPMHNAETNLNADTKPVSAPQVSSPSLQARPTSAAQTLSGTLTDAPAPKVTEARESAEDEEITTAETRLQNAIQPLSKSEKTVADALQDTVSQPNSDENGRQHAEATATLDSTKLEGQITQAEVQGFSPMTVRTTTNWAKAFAKETDAEIDAVLEEFLSQTASQADGESLVKADENSSVELEPEITIISPVKDAEADLDDRPREVETKEKFTYQFPSIDLLAEPEAEQDTVSLEELEENKRKLLEKLRIYKIEITRIEATVGPRVTLFELELAPDVKVSRIVALQDDLAMAMAARGIRIIAPIPGKNAVGVEIPNAKPRIVRIKSLLNSEKFKCSKFKLPVALGKTISNEIFIDDLTKMPHLLVAGATGSGKSVGINTILTSLLYFCSPEQVKFLLIDPKRVELFPYQRLKHHFLVKFRDLPEQIITDTSKAVYALKSVEKEMDLRYERLAKAGVRNLQAFNEKYPDEALPYIVVVIDELADMMITAGREVEEPIARLAQLARAVGIHLVVATQRPSVDVITGVIKANFPARIAYQVASKVDSRTILDTVGAEQLLGNGDMLYLPATQPKPIRLQNAFVSTEEVEALTEFIYSQKGVDLSYLLPAPDMKTVGKATGEFGDDDETGSNTERDKMFDEAARLVVRHQQGSVSLLQRRLKLGFGRAARIMDQLEEYGIVGPPDGSKPRQVLVQSEEELEALLAKLP